MLDAAAARGVSAAAIAVALGKAPTFFDALPPSLPVADYLRLLRCAAQLCGDPDFGLHAGEAVQPAAYMLLGFAVMS